MEYQQTVGEYLRLWTLERQHRRGALVEDYRQATHVIASYAAVDPAKLDPAQLLEIQQASQTLARTSRLLTTIQQPTPATKGVLADVSRQALRTALQQIADQGYLTTTIEDDENDEEEKT
jgi:DNA-binding FadR family transcriptional regulator